jgi:hypothetical protein
MVLFGFIFFVSVLALLIVREMDIGCERPARSRPVKTVQGSWNEKRSGFPAESMGLRQF